MRTSVLAAVLLSLIPFSLYASARCTSSKRLPTEQGSKILPTRVPRSTQPFQWASGLRHRREIHGSKYGERPRTTSLESTTSSTPYSIVVVHSRPTIDCIGLTPLELCAAHSCSNAAAANSVRREIGTAFPFERNRRSQRNPDRLH
jgi:hypothetical protein